MIYPKEKLEKLIARWNTPKGRALLKKIRRTNAYLNPVLFRDKAVGFPGINDPEVEDSVDLRGANLSGYDFRTPVQENDDGFSEDIAILSNIHFEGAILKHCNFQDGKILDCYFEGTDISHSNFKGATVNNCWFQQADCSGIDLHGAKLISCDFNDTDIKDITLDTTIVDQKTTFGEELKSEKEKNFHFASIEYKQIKEMYKNSSLHSLADEYHYKEMRTKRKINHISNPVRWVNYLFGDLLCKYGTSFGRVLLFAFLVMLSCALLYTVNESLLFHNQEVSHSLVDSLYFSIVTFTTLGYGDYHAIGAMRYVAAAEAFIGAALMALFTVIVARNIIRD